MLTLQAPSLSSPTNGDTVFSSSGSLYWASVSKFSFTSENFNILALAPIVQVNSPHVMWYSLEVIRHRRLLLILMIHIGISARFQRARTTGILPRIMGYS